MSAKRKTSVRKRIAFLCLALLAVLVLCGLGTAFSIVHDSQRDETRRADAAIVLGAGAADHEPSPVFRERINHAIWLYQNGYVAALIFTGGFGAGNNYSDASVAREYAIQNGVPAADIFIEEQSTITQENIEYAAEIVRRQGFQSVLIVSDPLHMRRAMLMARDYGLNAHASPTRTSRYQSAKTQIPFLARETFFLVGYRFYRLMVPALQFS